MKNVLAYGRWTQRGVVGGCRRAVQQPDCVGVESRGRGAGQVPVPNSSSLYTLFYSVIYNSVLILYFVEMLMVLAMLRLILYFVEMLMVLAMLRLRLYFAEMLMVLAMLS